MLCFPKLLKGSILPEKIPTDDIAQDLINKNVFQYNLAPYER